MVGYNQPKSLVGFKASMSDWAALDITAAVAWMRERYHTLPLNYVGHSFGGQALGLLANNTEVSRALLVAAQAGYWKLMASPERYSVYALLNFVGTYPAARLCAGMERYRRGLAQGCVSAMGAITDSESDIGPCPFGAIAQTRKWANAIRSSVQRASPQLRDGALHIG